MPLTRRPREVTQLILCMVGFMLLAAFRSGFGQELPLDSLLRANSYEISIESGVPKGEGFDVIVDAARDAQFFAIAEEHNVGELNELTTLLFKEVDLRPLRPYAHQNKIFGLSETFRQLLFQADAALIIRGGKTGSYTIVRG